MDFRQVAIVGTNCISVSIALGLKAQAEPPEITGCDANMAAANRARSEGAFDRVERKPGRTCRDADLVIVAEPLSSIPEVFAAIAPHLQPGSFVTDTAHLKAPVMRWAEELLPENVFFVGGHPIPNPAIVGSKPLEGLEAASADLLQEALYCFTPPTGTSDTMLDAFIGLAKALEAHPFFIDVTEHDGLQAGVEGLPDLLAIALLRATVDTPGWQEMRKFAGVHFATATGAADDAHERHTAVFLNREHVLRRLNVLLSELVHLRDLLTQDDEEALEEIFSATAEGRARWLAQREQGMWIKTRAAGVASLPTAGEYVRQMLFGNIGSRRRERADRSRKE